MTFKSLPPQKTQPSHSSLPAPWSLCLGPGCEEQSLPVEGLILAAPCTGPQGRSFPRTATPIRMFGPSRPESSRRVGPQCPADTWYLSRRSCCLVLTPLLSGAGQRPVRKALLASDMTSHQLWAHSTGSVHTLQNGPHSTLGSHPSPPIATICFSCDEDF